MLHYMWFRKSQGEKMKPSATGPFKSRPTRASSWGSIRRPDGTAEPRAQHQETKHSGAEPHCGETAEGEEEHAVHPQPPTRNPFCRDQTKARPSQNTLLCCCRRGRNVSCCSVWEDLPAHCLYRYECGHFVADVKQCRCVGDASFLTFHIYLISEDRVWVWQITGLYQMIKVLDPVCIPL